MRAQSASLHVAESGAGPPVLLVHGQPGLCTAWDPVTRLLDDDHRLLVPDRPGYGKSGRIPLGMGENADVLAELLHSRGGAPAVVVGHSYGGGVALLLAARHPEVVGGLVLAGSVGRADSVNGVDHVLALPALGEVLSAAGLVTVGRLLPHLRPLTRLLPDGAAARLRAGLPDRQYAAGISRQGLRLARSFVAEQRSLVAEIGDVERALAAVSVPCAVVTGSWDVIVPPSVAGAIAATIPAAELVIVARAGHFLPRDAPGVLAAAVRRVEARAGA